MELRETEYDPWSGETKKWYLQDNGDITCERSIDLTSMIDNCKEQANSTKGFSSKVKFHKVASLPPLIQHEILKNHHLDCFSSNPADQRKLEKIIELEYPVLKTNSSRLWGANGTR